jgi:hypothetical protein
MGAREVFASIKPDDRVSTLDRHLRESGQRSFEELASVSPEPDVRIAAKAVLNGSMTPEQFVELPKVSQSVVRGLDGYRAWVRSAGPDEIALLRTELARQAEAVGLSSEEAWRVLEALRPDSFGGRGD